MGDPWTTDFIREMNIRNVPLDFFSWHIYCADPALLAKEAIEIRSLLDRNGYEKTEI